MTERRTSTPQTCQIVIPDEPPGYRLLVIAGDRFATHPLPTSGQPVIGRSERCDIRVDDESISRRHVRLHLGPQLMVEDLESRNGTTVRAGLIAPNRPVEIFANEPFIIGSVTITVQKCATPLRSRLFWAHGYFEVRLAEECERARRSGGEFVLVRIDLGDTPDAAAIEEACDDALRSIDVVGVYAPSQYEIVLIEVDSDEAHAIVARLTTALEARGGSVARVALASYPRDASGAHALLALTAVHNRAASGPDGIVLATEGPMRRVHELIERAAPTNVTVLLLGETGVGKEVLAARIHEMSPRNNGPFLGLNCAAFSETLLESELFGHVKGAFTGAVKTKAGLLESASGGTVFLDEIGELPLAMQAKLLRVIEERKVRPVGGLEVRDIDVRFIAASNRHLEIEVDKGAFRSDLLFRINAFTVVIPPLRERRDEIPALAELLLRAASSDMAKPVPRIGDEALAAMKTYTWPGNIRELRNVLERALILCRHGVIVVDDLPTEKMRELVAPPVGAKAAADDTSDERQRIIAALDECVGNQTRAAKLLGMPRRTLVYKLRALDIPRPRKG